ncbi:hypothetical protein MAPG_10956 [Magnaporthiopsis poae ATCC 64411]|uniref:MINDY deubiquitinase domain-containing protein n=1 Tax=Magnaporthiopsis poae (strain ATCC 64411 / 73-15) TaxID=644358 RepID=A0A0C4EDZ6_MAGP6|nr:hypothetical protein MAPG_10956 [Magnaporthiopsis poae ATCC 64411]
MVTRKPVPDNDSLDSPMTNRPRPQDERRPTWLETDGSDSPGDIWGADHPLPQPTSSPGLGADGGTTNTGAPAIPNSSQPSATPPGPPPVSQHSVFTAPSDENVWNDHAATPLTADRTGGSVANNTVPDALRPGPHRTETNPFKRKPTPNSVAHNGGQPVAAPLIVTVPPTPPTAPFSQLNISNDTSNNPWQPAIDDKTPRPQPLATQVAEQDELGNGVWTTGSVSADASRRPSTSNFTGSPSLISFPTEEDGSAAWDEIAAPPKPHAPVGAAEVEGYEDRHAWDEVGGNRGKGKAPEHPPPPPAKDLASSAGHGSDWNLVDNDPQLGQFSRRSTWEDFEDTPEQPAVANNAINQAIKEPKELEKTPQTTPTETLIDVSEGPQSEPQEQPGPPPPPRTSSTAAPSQAPRSVDGKAETYQIKIINWYDANANSNPRASPILVQNENGPCPLVALVNALTLTTPAGVQTALVETLRSREQISLSFLLDAVFDELMSPRRVPEDVVLPDITELYSFLKSLHTGMNVNPRFVPSAEVTKAFRRTSLTHIHPTERSDKTIPGTFEDTTEMRLYSTFSVPLIHGWLPKPGDTAYDAFKRRAAESYEDAQNLLFREEELEDRLMAMGQNEDEEVVGLTEEEQAIYQDILTIKLFLAQSGTQLTKHGLEVITAAMKPGSVVILFRNDHFSTLYRHPQTLGLFTLVTDAGYASHAEIVWESLTDTTGETAEFFSGDFRVVGGATQHQQETMGRSPRQPQHQRSVSAGGGESSAIGPSMGTINYDGAPPLSPGSEQEDRDLALAMQLQEEEDQQHPTCT